MSCFQIFFNVSLKYPCNSLNDPFCIASKVLSVIRLVKIDDAEYSLRLNQKELLMIKITFQTNKKVIKYSYPI